MKLKENTSYLPMVLQSIGIGFIGILFPIAYLFLPMLFLTEAVDKGLAKTLGIFTLLCVLLGLVLPSLGLSVFSIFLPLILIMHYCLVSQKDLLKTLLLSTGVFMASLLVVSYTSGTLQLLADPQVVPKLIQSQKDLGLWQEGMDAYLPQVEEALGLFISRIPSLFLIVSLVVSYLTLTFTGRRLLTRGKLVVQPPAFFYFRLPKGLFYLLGGAILAFALFSSQIQDFAPEIQGNLTLLAGFLFFVQGMAVLDYFSQKLGLPRFLKVFLSLIILTTVAFQAPVALVGLLDAGLNFRKIKTSER